MMIKQIENRFSYLLDAVFWTLLWVLVYRIELFTNSICILCEKQNKNKLNLKYVADRNI